MNMMNTTKTDIEDLKLKGNPLSVPEDYFATLRVSVLEKIPSTEIFADRRGRFSMIPRPVLATALAFVFVFAISYVTISILTPAYYDSGVTVMGHVEDIDVIKEGFLYTSFIDFYDFNEDIEAEELEDTLLEEEIVAYLSRNADILHYLLAALD